MRRALLGLLLLPALAMAAGNPPPPADSTIGADLLKEFRTIEELAARSAYPEAERKAKELLPRVQDKLQAKALLMRNLATLYGLQKQYDRAAETLRQTLDLRVLPPADASGLRLEMAQYLFAGEHFSAAADVLSAWIEQAPAAKPEHFLLLAEIRSRLKQYAEAAALVERAIARVPEPKPGWYQFLLGLYHESRDYQGCVRTLAALIDRSPGNALYWRQLTGIYQEAGQEQQALAVRQLMYARGLLRSSAEIVQLAQVLRYRGLPNRAAELLQQEIDKGTVEAESRHYELLADAWTEARELRKAAAALEKAVALADVGNTLHRLGQIYSELHDWAKARETLSRALVRGGLKNPGGAYLLLGLAEYRLNARRQARNAFAKALDTPTVRKTAQQWLDQIDREMGQDRTASR